MTQLRQSVFSCGKSSSSPPTNNKDSRRPKHVGSKMVHTEKLCDFRHGTVLGLAAC